MIRFRNKFRLKRFNNVKIIYKECIKYNKDLFNWQKKDKKNQAKEHQVQFKLLHNILKYFIHMFKKNVHIAIK